MLLVAIVYIGVMLEPCGADFRDPHIKRWSVRLATARLITQRAVVLYIAF